MRIASQVREASWQADGADGWDEIGGQRRTEFHYENLTGVERSKLLLTLSKQFRTNGLAQAIVTLTSGFVLGGDVSFKADNPRVQKVLDKFWTSEWNSWEIRLFQRVKEWRLYGEQIWPVFVNPIDGFVRVGYISPSQVKSVTQDKDFPEELRDVVLFSKDGVSPGKKYQIITPTTMVLDASLEYEGEAFFLRANPLSDDPRGYSDLLTMSDFFASLDDLIFTSVERSAQQLNFTKHVKVDGVNKVDADTEKALRKKFSNQKPGSVVVTGQNITLADIIPSLAAAETAEITKTVVNLLSGSSKMPSSWLGFGEDATRVTLDKISGPTMKMLDQVRRELNYTLKHVCRYVIFQAQKAGVLSESIDTRVNIELPQIAEEDSREWGRAIAQVTTAAMLAHRNELITLKTASEMVKRVVKNIGVEYDPETEIKERKKEQPTLEQKNSGKQDKPTVPRSTEPAGARNNQ